MGKINKGFDNLLDISLQCLEGGKASELFFIKLRRAYKSLDSGNGLQIVADKAPLFDSWICGNGR